MKKGLIGLLIICVLFLSCTAKQQNARLSFEAMNTWMTIQVWGTKDAQTSINYAKQKILEIEELVSTTSSNSELYYINSLSLSPSAETTLNFALSPLTGDLATFSVKMANETNGAFNPCLYPVTKAWGFTTDAYTVPAAETIKELLQYTDYTQFKAERGTFSMPLKMQLDFGAVAKGYAGDMAIEELKLQGISSVLLDLGGNVQAFGSKPDGSPWKIGIRNPVGEGIIAGLQIQTGAVITSGGYERFFTADDGKKYIHIIDGQTGMPVDNGLVSVTVVAQSGAYADALSTALFVMGKEKAIEYWKSGDKNFDAIIISQNDDESLNVYYTQGIKDSFYVINAQDGSSPEINDIQLIEK